MRNFIVTIQTAIRANLYSLFFSTLAISQTCAPSISTNGSVTRVDFSNTTGNCTWTIPAGATNLFMETWGGGGAGGGAQGATASCPKKGGGGGGGAYANTTINLAAGTILNITVGAGGGAIAGAGASEVWTSSVSYVRATGGGQGGSISSAQSCLNTPVGGVAGIVDAGTGFPGGVGQAGSTSASGSGGGGANNGSAGGIGTSGSGGNPGTVIPPSIGGGGKGGSGLSVSGSLGGNNGVSYGGGGSGAWCVSSAAVYGGVGGDGHVRITYCNSIATPVFNSVAPICAGQTLTPLPSVSTNSIAGTWSPALNNTITKTYTFSPSGQCASTNTLTIVVNALPTITANATSSAVCLGQSTTLSGAGASTYTWSGGITNGTAFTPTANATYTVTGTATTGCTNTATKQITVNTLPVVTANATSTAVCLGQTTTLSGAGASTYTWSGGITNGTAFTPTANATYTVTGTAATGCTNTATKQITINTLPVVTANATSTAICLGQSTTLSGAGASTYTWSGGITNGTAFTPTVNATYTVTGTGVNGCSNTSFISITVNNLPIANINTSGPTTFCSGGSVILTADPSISYLWSNGATTQSISTSQSGNYTVQVTDINGCSSSSSVTSVNVNPTLVANITASGATTFCQGGSVLLTANSASSYLWSNGATTQTINVTQAGSYSVQLTSGAGCSGTSSITTIAVNPLPTVNVNSGVICSGQSFTMFPSGASTYTYSSGSAIVSPTANASYNVFGTDGNGCVSSAAAISNVTVNALPTINVNSGAICAGQSFTMLPSGASTYTYSSGSAIVSPTANASYNVFGTDVNGCTSSAAAISNVTVNALPTVNLVSNSTLLCIGQSATLTASGANSFTWNPGSQTSSNVVVSPTITTNYTVVGTNTLTGCSNQTILTQSVSPCAGIETLMSNNNLTNIYPNPTNGLITIEINSNSKVYITNALGQLIFNETMDAGKHHIDIQNQSSGIYFVQIIVKQNNTIENIKIVLQ